MSEIIDRYTENHNKIFFKVWVEKIFRLLGPETHCPYWTHRVFTAPDLDPVRTSSNTGGCSSAHSACLHSQESNGLSLDPMPKPSCCSDKNRLSLQSRRGACLLGP